MFCVHMTRGPLSRVSLMGSRSEERGAAAVAAVVAPVYTDGGGLHYFCEGREGGGAGGGPAAGLLRLFKSWRQDSDQVRILPGRFISSGQWRSDWSLPPNNIFVCLL